MTGPFSPVADPRIAGAGQRPRSQSMSDPAEPWETPVPRRDHRRISKTFPGRPFRPVQPADVPEAASVALEATCGPLPLERLYVIPKTTRLVNRTSCVISPAEVLGFGESMVAIWIDDGPAGRLIRIPVDSLLAIENRTILLYGRLRLVGAESQLTVRYNTVSRADMDVNLAQIRSRIAVEPRRVEPGFLWLGPGYPSRTAAQLPHKWHYILDNPMVRPEGAAAVAVGDLADAGRNPSRPATGVAVLSDRELVIVSEPAEYLDEARYGVDVLAVPRHRLDSLAWDGRSLVVRLSEGRAGDQVAASIVLPLDPFLVEAMACVFGDEVRWS